MKILRIIYDWPPPWDGLAPAPYEMTRAQTKLGHDVEIFCGRWPRSGKVEELPNTKLHPFLRELIPGTLLVTVAPLVFLYYLVWRRKNTPDIIHSHGHFGAYLYWYRVFLKKYFPNSSELKIPLVVHFHNTVKGRWVKIEKEGKSIKPISRYLDWPLALKSDQAAVNVADALIFVGEENRQEAIDYYSANSSKCFLVESGVNTDLFKPIGPEERLKTRNELGLDQDDIAILSVGAVVERKNTHLLVEALTKLPANYKLVIVGSSKGTDYEDEINDYIIKNSLTHRVIRVGYTPYPDVHIAYQGADIFVLPSVFEGTPKVVLESLACGVPVIASGFKLKDEVVGLSYLEQTTVDSIANSIKLVIAGDRHVDTSKIAGNYSWNHMARKVDEVYHRITSQNA